MFSRLVSMVVGLVASTGTTFGVPFDFRAPDAFNLIKVELDTTFGSGRLNGELRGTRGVVDFDPAHHEATRGSIRLDVRNLKLRHPKSNQDVHSSIWMDTKRFPHVSFEVKGIRKARWRGGLLTGELVGALTLKGKTKEVALPATFRYLRGKRRGLDGRAGDLLEVRAELSILRGDFGINAGGMLDAVANEISITVNLLGKSDSVRPLLPSPLLTRP